MTMSASMLVIVGLISSGVLLTFLSPLVFRETKRSRSLDRRLGVARRQAGMPATKITRWRVGDTAGMSLRALGLSLTRFGSMLIPISGKERDKIARLLLNAGFDRQDALSLFLSVKLGCALIFASLAATVALQLEIVSENTFLVVVAGALGLVVGGISPEYVLRKFAAHRQRKMEAALPHALDLMVMCLETGLTFERALAVVAEELRVIERNLANEFRIIDAEMRVGRDRRSVLQDYYQACEMDGLRDLSMAVIQGDRYGTPVAQATKNIAEAERVQRAARITAQAARLPALMTLPMLLFVVPGTMVLVAGPAFLNALTALSGLGK